MNWIRCVLILLLAGAGLVASPDAQARTTCEVDVTDLDFGLVDPSSRRTTATLNYECDTKGASGARVTVQMCLAIGTGIVPGSTESTRLMRNWFGDTLPFGIYKESNHAHVWGDDASTPSYLVHPLTYSVNNGGNGKIRGSITLYGYIPDLWGAAAGYYASFLWDTEFTYRYNDGPTPADDPVACDSGPGQMGNSSSFPFWVWAELPRRCDVRATNMDFGTVSNSFRTGNLTSTSTISLECSNRMPWQVGLDNGRNFDGSSRRVCNNGGGCILYRLNRPPGDGGGPWGTTLDLDTVADTSNREDLTVTGVISDQPVTQAGIYTDTITVIVTY